MQCFSSNRDGEGVYRRIVRRVVPAILSLAICGCALAVSTMAQQKPEDPEDDKKLGLWLDQGVSAGLWTNKSLEFETHQRFDEGASNLYEYFFQGGLAFRMRPWLTVLPTYRCQRFPASATDYENRILFNVTVSRPAGTWRPNLRTLVEGRFPNDRDPSARLRFRPGIDYVLPIRAEWRPALVVNNEFFLVPWSNPYSSGGSFTQNRVQAGIRLPITDTLTVRPYYLVQSVNLPDGWDSNQIIGISLAIKVNKAKK